MTKGKTRFFLAAAALAAMASGAWAQTPPSGSPVARHGTLKVVGNKIVGEHGNPVALRGMSFFWNTPSWNQAHYYTADVVNTLVSDWKVDVVRVAISPSSRTEANWKTVVDAAINKGIYVIIDWHSHTAENEKANAMSFFETQARAYKNTPNVIFEIFNEPIKQSWTTIRGYATDVVSSIRDSDKGGANNIIIIGTSNYSKRVDEAALSPVSGTNLAYALHFYTGHVDATMGKDTTNSEHRRRLRDWASDALNKGLAIFVSEMGISQPGGGVEGDGETNIIDTMEARRWFDFMDANQIGWANWSISNKPEAASALKDGGGNGTWNNGSANCNAFNGITPVTSCSNHGNLMCSGSFIRTKLRYYATPVTLSTATAGAGQGSVSASPPPPYYPAQQVTLTATAQNESRFEGWSSGVTGILTESPKAITLAASTSVEAVFFPKNLISNSTFTAGGNGWAKQPTTGASTPGMEVANGELTFSMADNLGTEPYLVRLQHGSTPLTQGKSYKLTFDARATKTRTITVACRTTSSSPSGHLFNIGEPQITTTKAAYEFEFNMTAATTTAGVIAFYFGTQQGNVTLDNVKLVETGSVSVLPAAQSVGRRASWSVSRAGGALRLSGPAEAGARVSLYDMRGKAIRSVAAVDGLALGAGVPAGSYFVVVKNGAGKEVLRTRVMTAR